MDPKLIKSALDALENNDPEACKEILKNVIAAAAGGATAEPPPAAEAGATQENAETPPPAPGDEDAEDTEALAALARETLALVGAKDAKELRAKLAARATAATASASTPEQIERRNLVSQLVQLRVELPARAWVRGEDGSIPDGDARVPVKRLAEEPLEELRARVADLSKAAGLEVRNAGHRPPPKDAPKLRQLSSAELEWCRRNSMTPEQFLERANNTVRRV